MRAYQNGAAAAAVQLGLIKSAATHMDLPHTAPPGAGPTGPFWAGVGADIKSQLIGDPAKYWSEIRNGTWHQKGSYARSKNPFTPHVPEGATGWQKAMAYAHPAMTALPAAFGLYQAYKAPAGQKGEMYGRTLGGLVGHIAGAPLGILGTMGAGAIGEHIGGSVGKLFNARPQQPAYDDPRNPRYADGRPRIDR